ncbi:MAG: hypothetical protein M1834_007207 [Cirrosporium novae-zelandiae]|nr:MAG: hypothetical protein M1834_007207 [Cirrosporium novae-zelandiae]
MSASTKLVRNAAFRGSSLGANGPMMRSSLTASSARLAYLRRHSRGLGPQIQALAILFPTRGYATDTSTSSGGGGPFPPPGFNAKEAKKPLPKEQDAAAQKASKSGDSKVGDVTKESINDIKQSMMHEGPTAVDKTKAQEKLSLSELAAEKAAMAENEEKKMVDGKAEKENTTIMQKVKKEVQHYWDGTKLLAAEVNISTKLALKMAAGYELSRREDRQLRRTVQDLARLVPFSVFVVVPFAELLLPIALRLFPNLLPSTYEGAKSREAKATTLRGTRKEVSAFLRTTMKESGIPISPTTAQRAEFAEFFSKVRATGESPSKDDVIKVCKLFKDDLTLDNLSRPQLVGMCRFLNLNAFGTDTMLRYHLRHRMRQIKRDDRAIAYEGVGTLSIPELQAACQSRGLRTHGMSPGHLRDDLQLWLDLRLKYGVPSTLLVLSNAYMYTTGAQEAEFNSQIEALQAVLSSIPEELFHEIELEVHNAEGAATNKQRLEVLREQQELIEEENEQDEEREGQKAQKVRDVEDIDEKEDTVKTVEAKPKDQKQVNEAMEAAAEGPNVPRRQEAKDVETKNAPEEKAKPESNEKPKSE